jgi:hypothetical protein
MFLVNIKTICKHAALTLYCTSFANTPVDRAPSLISKISFASCRAVFRTWGLLLHSKSLHSSAKLMPRSSTSARSSAAEGRSAVAVLLWSPSEPLARTPDRTPETLRSHVRQRSGSSGSSTLARSKCALICRRWPLGRHSGQSPCRLLERRMDTFGRIV